MKFLKKEFCRQVQLLVTSQDVENYKQIKSDLDQLRSIVEKSELWVYKRQGPDEGMDAADGLSTESEHKKVGVKNLDTTPVTVGSPPHPRVFSS